MDQVQAYMIDVRDNHIVLGHVLAVFMHAFYVWLRLKRIIPGWEGPSRRPYMRESV
jgi:hypothetical protein